MRRFPDAAAAAHVTWRWLANLLAVILLTGQVATAAVSVAPATGDPVSISFPVSQMQLRAGRSSVITFELPAPAAEDRVFKAVVEPEGSLSILREAEVLSGQTLGYLQVQPSNEGVCELRLGDATLTLHILPAADSPLEHEMLQPRLVSPARGAAVWGVFAVGVEVHASGNVHLELGKTILQPVGPAQIIGGMKRYVFEVDADAHPGVIELVAVLTRDNHPPVRSEPLRLLGVKPAAELLITGECEDTLDTPRTAAIGLERPRLGRDPAASGKRYVSSYSQNPVWAFSLKTEAPGSYQVMLVARGDEAAGAFPSIGLALNGEDRSTTGSRLIDAKWRRYPIGTPFYLDRGEHVIAAKFLNDFYAEKLADRNLYLDRYEIVRVAEPAAQASEAGMAGGGMMSMAAQNDGASMMMKSSPVMAAAAPRMMAMRPNMSPTMLSRISTSPGAMTSSTMMGLYQNKADAAATVSFSRPVDGLQIRGDVTLKAQVWWDMPRENEVPRTTLLINGKPFDAQHDQGPIFHISTAYFKPGLNTVQLLTELAQGGAGISALQTLQVPAETASEGYQRHYRRFAVADPAWVSFPNDLHAPKYPQGRRVAQFHTNSQAVLDLPTEMTGPYEVVLEAMGDEFQGKPIALVTLRIPGPQESNDAVVGQKELPKWLGEQKIGQVVLPAGRKQLVVAFINDHYVEKKGDRNLSLAAVQLRQPGPGSTEDLSPPAVELLYPPDGQEVYGVDALVAHAWDNDELRWVDVVIDGKPQELFAQLSDGMGKLVFPLLARTLTPGEHRVKLRARDRANNMAESREVTIHVLAEAPSRLTTYARAVRLLDRFGFGPSADDLAGVLTMGEQDWLKDQLEASNDSLGEQAAADLAMTIYPSRSDYGSVGQRVAKALYITPYPARARFVLWAQNHFSTWIRKTEAPRKWEEHERFSQLGPATFGELLRVSATSPAMLVYLDQARSFAGSINENYAREIMELHTLGVHAGYTQEDVTALANVLAGWTYSEEAGLDGTTFPLHSTFRFDPALSDGQSRQVFGMQFPAASASDRHTRVLLALDMLAAHPETARFIATQLAEHFVAMPAPPQLVDDLARIYLSTGGDMRQILLAIANHPAFWEADLAPRMARPIDYLVRLFRTTGADDVWEGHVFLERSGMGLFDAIAPDGYPEEDDHYADTNALLQRWRLAHTQRWRLSTLVPWSWQQPSKADPTAWQQRVVDLIAVRLTGQMLGETSNQAALDVLEKAEGSADDRIQQVGAFIASLPEASLH